MRRFNAALVILGLIFNFAAVCRAEDEKKDQDEKKMAVISAGDKEAIAAAMKKDAVVEGTVSRASWSRSGSIMFINFKEADESKFVAIVQEKDKDAVNKGFDGDAAKALSGAKIQVKGTIIDYKGKPEIIVSKPEQISVITKPGDDGEKKPDEKKE